MKQVLFALCAALLVTFGCNGRKTIREHIDPAPESVPSTSATTTHRKQLDSRFERIVTLNWMPPPGYIQRGLVIAKFLHPTRNLCAMTVKGAVYTCTTIARRGENILFDIVHTDPATSAPVTVFDKEGKDFGTVTVTEFFLDKPIQDIHVMHADEMNPSWLASNSPTLGTSFGFVHVPEIADMYAICNKVGQTSLPPIEDPPRPDEIARLGHGWVVCEPGKFHHALYYQTWCEEFMWCGGKDAPWLESGCDTKTHEHLTCCDYTLRKGACPAHSAR